MDVLKRNNVKIRGKGAQTIIFAHGFGCDQQVWKEVIQEFKADYRVVTFDYVGSGQSDRQSYSPERYGSLHGYKQDLLEVCASLEGEGFIFVGQSVSSMIGNSLSELLQDADGALYDSKNAGRNRVTVAS